MEKQTKKIIKWFWPWQDQKREAWLKLMSLDGWHLNSIGFSGIVFVFEQGERREFVYQLDFRQENKTAMSDYLSLFEEAGWEHVESYGGWQYFRKLAGGSKVNQIFTDNESKVQKYKRLRVNLSVIFPGILIIFLGNLDKYPTWFAALLVTIFVTMTLFIGTSLLMLTLRIKELEQEG
jgi:hypothetical protein